MSTRFIYTLGFLTISGLLLTSVYLQFFQGIEPCPLCALQRVCFGLLGIVFLAGVIVHATRYRRFIVNSLAFILSGFGMFLAGRQIWLQHYPPADNTCGASIQYMIKVLPWHQVFQKIIEGSAECSQKGWSFLSLNMAAWALIWFGIFLITSIYLFKKA